MVGNPLITTEEALEILYEIASMQLALIHKLMNALGQFEEFEKELEPINERWNRLEGKQWKSGGRS